MDDQQSGDGGHWQTTSNGHGGAHGAYPGETVAVDLTRLQRRGRRRRRHVIGWLVPMDGPRKHRDSRLVDGRNLVGTAADCEVVVADGFVSARHCVVRHEDGNVTITDLDSRNGVWLNGTRVHTASLVDNDRLRLGRTMFAVKLLW